MHQGWGNEMYSFRLEDRSMGLVDSESLILRMSGH